MNPKKKPKEKFMAIKMLNTVKTISATTMTLIVALVVTLGLLCAVATGPAHAKTTRIKDIVDIEGVRDNMLVGYGLVVGLNGT